MSNLKGKLIAIGGAEHKGTELEVDGFQRNNLNFFELGILRRVVEEAGGIAARIGVITTASMIRRMKWERIILTLLERSGAPILVLCISAPAKMR